MIQYLAYNGDARVFGLVVFLALLAAFALGYLFGARVDEQTGKTYDDAFGTTQNALLGLSALILGFTFSLAVSRFDGRRALVTQEANSIGTTYLRADYLVSPDARLHFHRLLHDYTETRIDHYRTFGEAAQDAKALAETSSEQDQLWAIATQAGRSDPRNAELALLTQTLNETIDLAATQETRLASRIPASLLAFVVLMVLITALLQGFGYGRTRHFKPFASLAFLSLVALVVFTIVDLDRPQHGLIRVNLEPLQTQLQDMLPQGEAPKQGAKGGP
jgi:hypothetical protein